MHQRTLKHYLDTWPRGVSIYILMANWSGSQLLFEIVMTVISFTAVFSPTDGLFQEVSVVAFHIQFGQRTGVLFRLRAMEASVILLNIRVETFAVSMPSLRLLSTRTLRATLSSLCLRMDCQQLNFAEDGLAWHPLSKNLREQLSVISVSIWHRVLRRNRQYSIDQRQRR
jgi:hypothetical protein